MTTALALMDREEAEMLTARIRQTADSLWDLLIEARDRKAWAALGYRTWGAYVDAEFEISRGHAGRLLQQGYTIRELEQAAKLKPGDVVVSGRQAAAIAPVTGEVAARVRAETKGKTPEQRRQRTAEIVDETARRPIPRPAPVVEDDGPAETSGDGEEAIPDVIVALLGSHPGKLARVCLDPKRVAADLKRWVDQFAAIASGTLRPAVARDRTMVTPRFKER